MFNEKKLPRLLCEEVFVKSTLVFLFDKKSFIFIVVLSGVKRDKVGEIFIGEYRHTIDEKNRLIIPSSFRQVLKKEEGNCIITKGFDRSLFLYTFSEWQSLGSKLRNLSTSRSDVRAFLRIFFSGAHPVKPDNQGRITIPQALKDFACIKDKVVIIGAFNKIEIWSQDLWENYYKEKKDIYEQIVEKIMDLGI